MDTYQVGDILVASTTYGYNQYFFRVHSLTKAGWLRLQKLPTEDVVLYSDPAQSSTSTKPILDIEIAPPTFVARKNKEGRYSIKDMGYMRRYNPKEKYVNSWYG